jgi:hypothetical protein
VYVLDHVRTYHTLCNYGSSLVGSDTTGITKNYIRTTTYYYILLPSTITYYYLLLPTTTVLTTTYYVSTTYLVRS